MATATIRVIITQTTRPFEQVAQTLTMSTKYMKN